MDFMSRKTLGETLHSVLEASRRHFTLKLVARFLLIVGAGLCVDYLLALALVCRFLATPYDFLFCPLLMYIYAVDGGFSYWEHAWSLRSLLIVVLAAAVTIFWAAKDFKETNIGK